MGISHLCADSGFTSSSGRYGPTSAYVSGAKTSSFPSPAGAGAYSHGAGAIPMSCREHKSRCAKVSRQRFSIKGIRCRTSTAIPCGKRYLISSIFSPDPSSQTVSICVGASSCPTFPTTIPSSSHVPSFFITGAPLEPLKAGKDNSRAVTGGEPLRPENNSKSKAFNDLVMFPTRQLGLRIVLFPISLVRLCS